MEWVDVRARTVESAIATALQELGLESAEHAEIEVLENPEKGFLGIGRTDAVVRVKPKPKPKRRRRRRSQAGNEQRGGQRDSRGSGNNRGQGSGRSGRQQQESRKGSPKDGGRSQGRGSDSGARGGQEKRSPDRGSGRRGGQKRSSSADRGKETTMSENDAPAIDINEQAEVVNEFLTGLLDAFGLDGTVAVTVDDGFILANVDGEQTEALIGHKAVILQSIHELTKTVVQRRTQSGARLRLDIGGYAERRREALTIYATRLASQVIDEDEEVMLEPMNPADRKVVHDAVGEIDGVRSFSEGEDPRRSVVIAPDED